MTLGGLWIWNHIGGLLLAMCLRALLKTKRGMQPLLNVFYVILWVGVTEGKHKRWEPSAHWLLLSLFLAQWHTFPAMMHIPLNHGPRKVFPS